MLDIFSFLKQTPSPEAPIYFHNSKSRKKERFAPLEENKVTMYSCGPTVYDHIHIGNLRAYLVPDLIKRLLILNEYTVEHTINFTDFGHLSDDGDQGEDKMVKALKRNNLPITLEAMTEVALPYIESFEKDMEAFNNLPPDHYTRASAYVQKQIELIASLLEKGIAYETSDGIYFDISEFPRYGELGNIDIDNARAGARVAVNPEKRNPADFALWKKANLGWESAWGNGFPGWHIECTAMIFDTLGETIDIHTGGEDLKYTHHNAEIAQAEALTGKPFVNYWIHNAFVTIEDEKIAKSDGNGITLSELDEKGYSPHTFRYLLLTAHYRSQVNFTFKALDSAKVALLRLHRFVYEELGDVKPGSVPESYKKEFFARMNNDVDTPGVLALLFDIMKDKDTTPADVYATILLIDSFLGIGLSEDLEDGRKELGIISQDEIPEEIKELLAKREVARIAQNWDEADKLRDALLLKGYTLEDTPKGARVFRKE